MSPIRIIVQMAEPDCFLRYRINAGTRNFTGLARKYQWYNINDIYHDSIMIFSSEKSWYFLYFWYFRYFQNINNYYYYLLTSLIHAYLTQTAQVPKLLDGAKILTKILTLMGRVQQRRRRQTETDSSCHRANMTQDSCNKTKF